MAKTTESNKFDAIIIGSGPGGATVARELTKKKKKVLILEWGGNAPIRGSFIQIAQFGVFPGRSLLFTDMTFMAMFRAIITGGSSIMYYATAFDPPLNMLKSYGVDISKEVEELKKELPIAPLSDELTGPMAKRIMESAQDLGHNWQKLNKFIYQDKCRINCDKCNLGCPYGAKWNARMFMDEAVKNGAELITRAKVKKILIDKNRAVGVEYKRFGITHREEAPLIVVSAGGIGSPIILRASGIKNAGYNFFIDPLICVMGTVNDIKGGKEVPMAAGCHFKDDGYLMTDMTIPNSVYMSFTAEVFRFDRIFSHSRTLQIMIKEKDNLRGRITDWGGVRKSLTDSDKGKLAHGYERAKKILERAGARNIFKTWYFAAHPGGTAKIKDVVDSNLKTQYDNLYVCDCSVLPEEWGMPPTLTILSLGKRLAKHLSGAK